MQLAKVTLIAGDDKSHSPYGIPADWYMATAKAEVAGFTFSQLKDWLPGLVQTLVKHEGGN
ncbi:hypothetical protein [Lysinibacillus contaminans]|uniref:hypothetical protein n=1 Tax=Lysinibacillus contaminans TaxID=1293441 RepID=UPI001FDFB4C8|nr:hypothetical protein [Lysinibacillus contaminans]